jgi:hypothetical protein
MNSINSIFVCGTKTPSDRLVATLALYYDSITIPICAKPKDEIFDQVLSTLPVSVQSVVLAHTEFGERFGGIPSSIISCPSVFPEPSEKGRIDMTPRLKRIAALLSPDSNPEFLGMLNLSWGMGFYHGFRSTQTGAVLVPISTDSFYGKSLVSSDENHELADILASWLAIEAIQLSLPEIQPIHPLEIQWAREFLAEDLEPFRSSMYMFASELRQLVKDTKDPKLIRDEAIFFAKSRIAPAVSVLKRSMELKKRSFARKIILCGMDSFKLVVEYFNAPNPLKVAEIAKQVAGGAMDISEYRDSLSKLNNEQAISYLAKVSGQFQRNYPAEAKR